MKFSFPLTFAIVVCFLLPFARTRPFALVKDTFVLQLVQHTMHSYGGLCRIHFICRIEIKNLERSLPVGLTVQHINVSLLLLGKN